MKISSLLTGLTLLLVAQSSFATQSDCDVCQSFSCSYKGSTETVARLTFGAEPPEYMEFEHSTIRALSFKGYLHHPSDDNVFDYFYFDIDGGPVNSEGTPFYVFRSTSSLYLKGQGEILINVNGAPIKNGEYACTVKAKARAL